MWASFGSCILLAPAFPMKVLMLCLAYRQIDSRSSDWLLGIWNTFSCGTLFSRMAGFTTNPPKSVWLNPCGNGTIEAIVSSCGKCQRREVYHLPSPFAPPATTPWRSCSSAAGIKPYALDDPFGCGGEGRIYKGERWWFYMVRRAKGVGFCCLCVREVGLRQR